MCEKFILFSLSQCSKQRSMFHFFKAIFYTSFKLLGLFFRKIRQISAN